MGRLKPTIIGLALTVLTGGGILIGWLLYRHREKPIPPDIVKAGGTVLVYEVDESRWPEGKKPEGFSVEDLTNKLKKRLDPADEYGVTVRPLGNTRVEISLPHQGNHEKAGIQLVKELIASTGALEFRILANPEDDREGIEAAKAYFASVKDNPAELEKLKLAASRGQPPPGPSPPKDKSFHTPLGDRTYVWVELGPSERYHYELDDAGERVARPDSFWKQMEEARREDRPVEHNGLLFYSRDAADATRLSQKDRGKKHECFLLTREEPNGEALSGALLESVDSAAPSRGEVIAPRGQFAVSFRFNPKGTALLRDLTTKNKDRYLGIILDDVIQSAPVITQPLTQGAGIITGNFTPEEVDRMVTILRSGALPATLKPIPVSETTVEPRK